MPPVPVLILYAMAVARLTTIITTDEISRPIRRALVSRFDPTKRVHRWIVYAIGTAEDSTANGCPWCVSVWVSAATSPMLWCWQHSSVFLAAVIALAASQATGMIFRIGRH